MKRLDGTMIDVRTARFPPATTNADCARVYEDQLAARGMKIVGYPIIDVQQELFSSSLEVTFRARLALKEANV